MTDSDIKKLFPAKCFITQSLIDNGTNIGNELLKEFIPTELWEDMFWGLSIGTIKGVKIKTEQSIIHNGQKLKVPLYLDCNIKEPKEIIFELRQINNQQ